jgi:hypothetical protein
MRFRQTAWTVAYDKSNLASHGTTWPMRKNRLRMNANRMGKPKRAQGGSTRLVERP